jgi:cytochrome c biogenesis protein CcdA
MMAMIWLPAMIIGAVWGALRAKKRGGNRLDAAQYGAVYAIGLGLLAVFLSIVIDRLTH